MSHHQPQIHTQKPPKLHNLLKNVFRSQPETHQLFTIFTDFVDKEDQGMSGTRESRDVAWVGVKGLGFPESRRESHDGAAHSNGDAENKHNLSHQDVVPDSPSEAHSSHAYPHAKSTLVQNQSPSSAAQDRDARQKQKITLWNNIFTLHGSIHRPLNFQKYRKRLKSLIRYHGVPPIFRAKVWLESSGAHWKIEQNRGYYAKMIQIHSKHQNVAERQIELDLARTFPTHPYFSTDDSEGRARLRRILNAFSWRNPLVAYCQSLNFIVGILLLHFEEDEAFWMLVVILEEILPADFYNPTLKGVRTDGKVLDSLIEFYLPKIHKKFQELQMDTSPFVTRWFMTLYVDVLPIETAMRVWDVMFNEGSKVMFRVALALLKLNEQAIMRCSHMGEVMNLFNEVTENMHDADRLMKTCFSFYTLRNKSIDRKRATCATLVEQETLEMEARRVEAQKRRREREKRLQESDASSSRDHTITTLIVQPATPSRDAESAPTTEQSSTASSTEQHLLMDPSPLSTLNSSHSDHSMDASDDEYDDMDAQIDIRMSSALQEGELDSLAANIREADNSAKSPVRRQSFTRRSSLAQKPTATPTLQSRRTTPSHFTDTTAAHKLYKMLLQSQESDIADLKELDILMQQHEMIAAAYE